MPLNLLLSIAKCREFDIAKEDQSHPCHTIVSALTNLNQFKPPEPWAGSLQNAKVIAVGANPSLGIDHDRKNIINATDQDLFNFYENMLYNGKCRHWTIIRKRLENELPKLNFGNNFNFQEDCVLVEVVHCRSNKSFGVDAAAQKCGIYFDEILNKASNATHIVCFGKVAERLFKTRFCYKEDIGHFTFDNKKFKIAFLPHPSAWIKKTTEATLPQQ